MPRPEPQPPDTPPDPGRPPERPPIDRATVPTPAELEAWASAVRDVRVAFEQIGSALAVIFDAVAQHIAQFADAFAEAFRAAYRADGQRYGDSDEGMWRWLSEQIAQANEQAQREELEDDRQVSRGLRTFRALTQQQVDKLEHARQR